MRVLVLGGGYAGLVAARTLERELPERAELVVVDATGAHLIQHELHRVIRRPSFADHLSIPLHDILQRADLLRTRVTGLDTGSQTVQLANGDALNYDAAAVCLGAETADYGLPGVAEHGQPLKRLSHANAIRDRFDRVLDGDGGHVLVGGGGLSGIQTMGELAALRRERDATEKISLTLVEMADTIAPGFPSRFQELVASELEGYGVKIRTDTRIAEASEDSVRTASGQVFDTAQFIWTGGIRGPAVFGGERPSVRADLEVGPATFGAGDAITPIDTDGEPVPPTAQSAVAAGEVCARNVLRALDLGPTRPARFTFDALGWLVSVGDEAIAQVGPSVFSGPPAQALKATAGVRYLAEVGAVRQALEVVHGELYGD